ncbi:class I tRNA ligase family protein [Longispora sp. K20-0274]|uniref:class I tRNA ligase family protein n=1 Tax=Longispora sp. K20-0274 TaxID=3088255 RepID=UPI0039995301
MSTEPGGLTLITAIQPTPNGPLHLGHLSGPYVAADIAARAARMAGKDVMIMGGLDSHQNYVLTRAEADGRTGAESCAAYSDLIRRGMAAARLEYDLFLDPQADDSYRRGVAALFTELVDGKVIPVGETTLATCADCARVVHHARVSGRCPHCGQGASGGTCEGCGSFLSALDLLDATSTCHGTAVVPAPFRVPVLKLEEYRSRLAEHWAKSVMPPRVRTLLAGYLAAGLPEIPLAYPSDWGIAWDCDGVELRIDVWAEMALGYLYAVSRHLDADAPATLAACVAGWAGVGEMWNFFGIDNAFYHLALIPAVLQAAGLRSGPRVGLVVNEFYLLDGMKFSTSRGHAIWAHELLATEDPAVVRAYLSWDRPDTHGTDFTLAGFTAFKEYLGRILAGVDASPLPAALADAELERALRALRLETFDVAAAVRGAVNAHATRPERARRVLDAVFGIGQPE